MWWSKSISSLLQKWFPFLGCRWQFTVWTFLGEKSHLIEHASVTICYDSSPLPPMLLREAGGMSRLRGQIVMGLSFSQSGHMSPSTVTTAVTWLERTTLGPRADVTAPWGCSTSNQHSWFPVSPLAPSCCLALKNVALAVTPTPVFFLFSLPWWSHSSVCRPCSVPGAVIGSRM